MKSEVIGGLWVSPREAHERVVAALDRLPARRISIAEVGREAFGVDCLDHSASTQIGIVLAALGLRRVEQRTRKPRYVYER